MKMPNLVVIFGTFHCTAPIDQEKIKLFVFENAALTRALKSNQTYSIEVAYLWKNKHASSFTKILANPPNGLVQHQIFLVS